MFDAGFFERLMRLVLVCFLWASVPICASQLRANDSLPWEKDFESAREKAIREGKPLFVMMTATWCGPCKMLESKTLPNEFILSGLKDFIWVQAFEDKDVESRYKCRGYPTLAFVEPQSDKVFSTSVGYQPVAGFLKTVIKARKDGGMPLSDELTQLESKVFNPDMTKIRSLIDANDGHGLKEYLEPASEDVLREKNFLLLKVSIPEGLDRRDVVVLANSQQDQFLSKTGLMCISIPTSVSESKLQIFAPGCQVAEMEIKFPKNEAIATKVVKVTELTAKNSVKLGGMVAFPDGSPAANAIIRIADVAWVKADKNGKYQFPKLPIGQFDIRVECPGGELQDQIKLVRGKPMKQDIVVRPAATIGIRWAVQMDEGSTKLTGEGLREGEAYFSASHSRFSLLKGMHTSGRYGSDFCISDDLNRYEKVLKPNMKEAIAANAGPKLFFFSVDGSSHGNGLHLEDRSFSELTEIDEQYKNQPHKYFQMLRGDLVKVGQVYSVYCCQHKLFAKMEIISVTEAAGAGNGSRSRR